MKKRALSLFLSIMMVVSMLPAAAFADGNVAKIGDQEYSTLQAAFDAAGTNDTVKLIADVDLTGSGNSEQCNVTKSAVFDLNGHTLKGSLWSGDLLSTADETMLTVVDSSENKTGQIYSKYHKNDSGAMLQANAITSFQHAVTINGGTFLSNNVAITCQIQNSNAAEGVIINGGTFKGSTDRTYGFDYSAGGCVKAVIGTVTINGGTFEAAEYGSTISAESGDSNVNTVVNIYDGIFSGATLFDFGVDHSSKTIINVYGGSFSLKLPDSIEPDAKYFAYDNVSVAALVNNNYFQLNIMGGKFNYDPSAYVPSGCEITSSEGIYTVTDNRIAKIGDVGYTDIAAALKDCKENETVELLKDVELSGDWTPVAGFNGTFDGNNHVITGLNVSGAGDLGLFANTGTSAVIKNLTISGASITGTGSNVGALAGSVSGSKISHVSVVYSTVTGENQYTGGLIGYGYPNAEYCTVSGCTITGKDQVGGIIGYLWVGGLDHCASTGNTVKATEERAGGLIGKIEVASGNLGSSTMYVINSTVSGGIAEAPDYAGGIAGQLMGDVSCYNITGNAISNIVLSAPAISPIGTIRRGQNDAFMTSLDTQISENTYTGWTAPSGYAAQTDSHNIPIYYKNLASAFANVKDGETVKLINDAVISERTEISGKNFTLDTNGHTVTYTTNGDGTAANFDKEGLIRICGGSHVTVTGNGTFNYTEGNWYAGYLFMVYGGSVLTIENGSYNAACTIVQAGGGGGLSGAAIIKGGSFKTDEKYDNKLWTLNKLDNSGSVIEVSGGTFYGFDPANGATENPSDSFCAKGYMSTDAGNGAFVVEPATNKTVDAVKEALEKTEAAAGSGASDDDKNAAKDAVIEAVKAVENIENTTLAENSTTLENLKALETALVAQTESDSSKGTITAETSGTAVSIANITVANAALSADVSETVTSSKDQKIEVKVADKAEGAVSLDTIKSNAKAKAEEKLGQEAEAGAVVQNSDPLPLDITMVKKERDKDSSNEYSDPVSIVTPAAPVVITFDLPEGWDNCKVVYVEDSGTASDEDIPTTVNGNKVSAVLSHFSTYVLVQTAAADNDNEYEIILTPDKTRVSAGDTITYTLKLKHTAGTAEKLGYFRYAPACTQAGLLEQTEQTAETGVSWSTVGGVNGSVAAFTVYDKSLTVGGIMTIGSITYKVKAYETDDTPVVIGYNADVENGITNKGYQAEAKFAAVSDADVVYDIIKVSFTYGDASKDTMYARYGSKNLYETLDAAYEGTTTSAVVYAEADKTKWEGSVEDGNQYRLLDTYWHLTEKTGTSFAGITTAGFKADADFVVNNVQLYEITSTSGISITSTVTERSSKYYVDKGTDLTFTASAPLPGSAAKNITVKVKGTQAAYFSIASEQNLTVTGSCITGPVSFEISNTADLTGENIKIFTTGSDTTLAYVQYSAYSGDDTLVLIKGKDNANYELSAGNPVIYKLTPGAYDGGWTHAVLVSKTDTVTTEAMINNLNNLGLVVTENSNTVIDYDWNTNGKSGIKLADAQATHDFQSQSSLRWTPSDELLLKADVMNLKDDGDSYTWSDYTQARDGRLSDADINAFLYYYAQWNQ